MTKNQEENLQALQNLAKSAAEFRGHSIREFGHALNGNTATNYATCTYHGCIHSVSALLDLKSGSMLISGSALFTTCPSEDDHEPHLKGM